MVIHYSKTPKPKTQKTMSAYEAARAHMQEAMADLRADALFRYRAIDGQQGARHTRTWWLHRSELTQVQCYTHLHNCNKAKFDKAFARLTESYSEMMAFIQEMAEDESSPCTEGKYLSISRNFMELRDYIQELGEMHTRTGFW